MIKKLTYFGLISLSSTIWSATYVELHRAPLTRLNQFSIQPQARSAAPINNDLKLVGQSKQNNEVITRYQQFYKGIPIVGAQVMINKNPKIRGINNGQVNGHLFNDIQLNIKPAISTQQAIELAKKSHLDSNAVTKIFAESAQLQIRATKSQELQLVYLVSFKTEPADQKPMRPYFIIDAQTGEVIKQWNNIHTYSDNGPGGNEKVHEYWYGKDDLPTLEVAQNGSMCTFDDGKVLLVNLHSVWDWESKNRTPVQYQCNTNTEDLVHGSYSAGNDAYYFGHTIVDLYKNWYGVNALEDSQGNALNLVMRVHFGKSFDNAFWDPDSKTMSFGDGDYLYPLVSLDVAAHEVSHGFTQQHADLEYHDEPGALNEAFSDMAGQAAKAYLLETAPKLYNKAYLTPDELTWTIGETLIPSSIPMKAIRFLDIPSSDGDSADCVDKKMARMANSICAISYPELLVDAETQHNSNEQEKQSYIVHTASGVFNRVFYLMSQQIGVKKAFHTMLLANTKYWTPTTGFQEGACGVLDAATDLQITPGIIESSFRKVGIDVTQCMVK